MLTDSTPLSIISEANIQNQSVEERNRREEAVKNIDFFYSKQEKYINRINTEVDPVSINLVAPIIKKKLSLLYTRPLKRDYEGPSTSVSFIENLYKNINIDYFLRKVDLAAELTGTGLVFVVVNDDNTIFLKLYDGSEISVIQDTDNADIPIALSLVSIVTQMTGNEKNPQASKHLQSEVWTDEYITTFINGARQTSERNEAGFIPVSVFKGEDVYNQFLGHAPAEQMQQLNGYINQQLTNLGYMIKMESATPIVVKGFENGEGIKVSPGSAISLPMGAEVNVLNLNPKIKDTLDEIMYLEAKLFETTGIPKVSVVGDESAKSGRELLIRWSPLLQVFNEKTLRYKHYELNLANMILKVAGLEPLVNINIGYPEEQVLPLEDTDDRDNEIRYGLTTPVDELQKKYPSLSEEEAESIVRSNIDFNLEIGRLTEGQVPSQSQEE